MKIALTILSHDADEAFLPVFVPHIQALWPGVPLYLATEPKDKLKSAAGLGLKRLKTSSYASKKGLLRVFGVLDALAEAAEDSGAEWVGKLDCDALHRSTDWFDPDVAGDVIVQGMQHPWKTGFIIGLAYALRASAIADIRAAVTEMGLKRVQGDDDVISAAARYVSPYGFRMKGARNRDYIGIRAGWRDADYDAYNYIHCGQVVGRDEGPEVMGRLLARPT